MADASDSGPPANATCARWAYACPWPPCTATASRFSNAWQACCASAGNWRQEQAARNAEQAVELGRELYQRLSVMTEHMSKVGGNLDKAVDSYNAMVGSYDRKVIPQLKKFEELQIPTEDRAIEAPAELGVKARSPQAQLTEVKSDTPLLDALQPQAAGGKRK